MASLPSMDEHRELLRKPKEIRVVVGEETLVGGFIVTNDDVLAIRPVLYDANGLAEIRLVSVETRHFPAELEMPWPTFRMATVALRGLMPGSAEPTLTFEVVREHPHLPEGLATWCGYNFTPRLTVTSHL